MPHQILALWYGQNIKWAAVCVCVWLCVSLLQTQHFVLVVINFCVDVVGKKKSEPPLDHFAALNKSKSLKNKKINSVEFEFELLKNYNFVKRKKLNWNVRVRQNQHDCTAQQTSKHTHSSNSNSKKSQTQFYLMRSICFTKTIFSTKKKTFICIKYKLYI